MITGPRPGRGRVASLVVIIGLLGTCAVLVVLTEPGRSPAAARSTDAAVHQAGPSARQRGTAAARAGLRLMGEAAVACRTVAFRGLQVDAWPGATSGAVQVQVWHQPGQPVLARYSGTGDGAVSEPASGDAAWPDQADVLTVTAPLLALMRANYVITYAGDGRAGGRPAQVIDVRRADGSLAARYWLDRATELPLRRELLDGGTRVISEDTFVTLSLGQPGAMPSAAARPWADQLGAARRAALRASGWPVPQALAGSLSLFAATQTVTASGRVVELSYSDGLSVVSVFLQRGELPARLPGGWRAVTARGREVYAIEPGGQSLAWSAGGYVVTVISDAPAGTVDQAVASLATRPAGPRPGFWPRMGRGFRRLLSWVNPLR